MERITFEGNFCDISMCRENPCPYNGMCSQRETWERLKEYEDAEQDGRLVVLPCKVGAPVYTTHWWKDVKEKCTDSHGNPFYRMMSKKTIKKERFDPFGPHYEWLGKTVFLTRDEAEAALKGCEGRRTGEGDNEP